MNSYLERMRRKIGTDSIIHPGARILIENSNGEILFVKRADNGNLGLPSGAFDGDETIAECIVREVFEETGLRVNHVIAMGISSSADTQSVVYPNGDKVQYFTIEFYADSWEGTIQPQDTDEIDHAFFGSPQLLDSLPPNERVIKNIWKQYRETQRFVLM